ncbi:thioredoxin-like protein [Rhypophila decipiens]|uniref:Thioredoxin-like protein n=1 Tax=Rhypophila decipiens TaxID=261697 RepID=A0AAN6XW46_9PEZI|nr:thioredoxin-like protein [Rhypophila decipiens]
MAKESEPIILFDIPSRKTTPWSFNPWKTRFILNYKGIPHKTEWVEYPNIRGRLEGHVPPGADEDAPYTVPTIKFPDGTYLMDSRAISVKLEELYPNPLLPGINHPSYNKVITIMRKIVNDGFLAVFLPLVPKNILSEVSQEYWYKTRTVEHGDLSVLWKTRGGKKGMDASTPGFQEVTKLYLENDKGPFIEGDEITYADFLWAGYLLFFKALGEYTVEEEGEDKGKTVNVYEEFLSRSGERGREVHEGLLKAVEKWSEVK